MFLRYSVYPVETLTQFAAFYDFGAAAASATPLLVITLLVLAFERRFLRDRTYGCSRRHLAGASCSSRSAAGVSQFFSPSACS